MFFRSCLERFSDDPMTRYTDDPIARVFDFLKTRKMIVNL